MFCYQKALGIILFILSCNQMPAQVLDQSWKEIVHKSKEEWFATPDAITIAENVLLYQRNIGGWPKNVQIHKPLNETEKTKLLNLKTKTEGCTTDNGATVLEMIFLSKIYKQVPEERYKEAFLSGLNYLLEAQYKNGGWPQFYPLKEGYYSHITYNDNSMVNILNVFKEIIYKTGYFSIKPSEKVIERLQTAFNKGVDCILKTQYKQNGELTAWCAQHDEITLLPAKARAYELPSLSGGESAGIVILLMSIKDPSPEIINAVNKAVNWFEKTKISGLKEVRHYADDGRLKEKVMVQDPDAKPLWARFMELQDNRPFFCDRDGIKKYSMAEIGEERRNGYAWYIDKPIKVLTKYDDWKKKHAIEKSNKKPANEYKMTVAKDGSGDYVNIQDAINNAKSFPYRRVEIFIKNGVYNEKVKIHEWNTYISLIGESKEKTIIFYDDHFKKIDKGRNSTFLTYTVLVEGNDFTAKNLTIQNTAGDVGQAIALSVNADRCYIKNCNILGNQDTLYTSGEGFRQYFSNCYIEGTTDFIFGQATV